MSRSKRNTLYRRVQGVYSQDRLARICTLPERKFGRAFGMQTVSIDQHWPHDYYHFKDNGAKVLAVAHLDTVVAKDRRTPHFRDTKSGPLIISGALDDRLGAYVILDMLPKLDITCDWLLTVGEESGMSTARLFDQGKDYDWIIEFDRGGTDVVMYQYEDEDTIAAVRASGAIVGDGIFSDIGCLEHLGVKAFNWGVGYRGDYHSERGYAFLRETFVMVAKYLRFHAQNAGTAMPHQPGWLDDDWLEDSRLTCQICGAEESVNPDTDICAACEGCQLCWQHQDDCMCYHGPALSRAAG